MPPKPLSLCVENSPESSWKTLDMSPEVSQVAVPKLLVTYRHIESNRRVGAVRVTGYPDMACGKSASGNKNVLLQFG